MLEIAEREHTTEVYLDVFVTESVYSGRFEKWMSADIDPTQIKDYRNKKLLGLELD